MKSLKALVFLSITFYSTFICCGSDSISRSTRQKRLILLGAGVNTVYVGSMIVLNEVWYKENPRTHFHFFNDNHEWKQMDKAGHFTTSFHESVFGVEALKWAGLPEKKAICIGSLAGFIYQTPIEYFDGRSAEYGASWGDLIANASGTGLVACQYLLWKEIRIQPKFSFHRTSLAPLKPDLLGSNWSEEIIKDYNGQTYWASANISSFIRNPNGKFPKWLNIAFGYGAHDMVRASDALSRQEGFSPYRQYYISFDVDFSHVPTRKKWIKYILYPLNFIHIPAPALEFSKKGIHFHPVYF